MATGKVKRVAMLTQGRGSGYVTVDTYKLIMLEDGTQIYEQLLIFEGHFHNDVAFVEAGDEVEYRARNGRYEIEKVIFKH